MMLYRLVSEEEARDIDNKGVLRHPYGGLEVKEFWLQKSDAITYLADAMRSGYSPPYVQMIVAIVHGSLEEVPHQKMMLDGRPALVISGEALYRLNKIVELKWVNLESDG